MLHHFQINGNLSRILYFFFFFRFEKEMKEIFITINACVHIFFFLSVICCRHVKYLYFNILCGILLSLLTLLVLFLLVYSLIQVIYSYKQWILKMAVEFIEILNMLEFYIEQSICHHFGKDYSMIHHVNQNPSELLTLYGYKFEFLSIETLTT